MTSNRHCSATSDLLVIGYGNTLRRDDGVGSKVAEAVAALNLPGVSVIVRHQLVPELAEPISQARGVIFVDAAVNANGRGEWREIEPNETGQLFAHATDPRSLLALAGQLFGRSPPAWSLAVPVEDLGFGDGLSPRAEVGLRVALKQVQSLVQRLNAS